MTDFAAIFAASFVYVALRSWQQLNVQHGKYAWVLPTAMAMGVVDVFLIVTFARRDTLWSALPFGLGGGLGCMASMWLHKRMRTRK